MKMINHSIDLHDVLSFEACDAGIWLTSNQDSIPLDERNLVIKAAQKLLHQFDVEQGLKFIWKSGSQLRRAWPAVAVMPQQP